jgi:hypothetical protein
MASKAQAQQLLAQQVEVMFNAVAKMRWVLEDLQIEGITPVKSEAMQLNGPHNGVLAGLLVEAYGFVPGLAAQMAWELAYHVDHIGAELGDWDMQDKEWMEEA